MPKSVIHHGFLDLQVCVPSKTTDEEATAFANETRPTGIVSPWVMRKEGHHFLHGAPYRVPCAERANHVHIMFDC